MATLRRILGLSLVGILLSNGSVRAQENAAPVAPEPEAQPAPDAAPAPKIDPAPNTAPATIPDSEPPEANPFSAPQAAPVPYSDEPAPPAAASDLNPPADPFLPPYGMTTPPQCLIEQLGFFGHHPFVYSDTNCFDLASSAYRCGHYEDAIALLSHAIEQNPQAHYYYLRGMAQMKAGLAHDAIASADGVLDAVAAGNYGGLDRVRERFNGPLGVQFRQLLKLRRAS